MPRVVRIWKSFPYTKNLISTENHYRLRSGEIMYLVASIHLSVRLSVSPCVCYQWAWLTTCMVWYVWYVDNLAEAVDRLLLIVVAAEKTLKSLGTFHKIYYSFTPNKGSGV